MPNAPAPALPSAASGSPPARLPALLIVDDDSGQRDLVGGFLRSQGFQVTAATSGQEALDLLATREFALVISDVRMPGMTGLETLRHIRERHGALPVLLVTAYADIREAVGAMRDGAVNYLAKPIDLDELLVSVRHAIGLASVETDLAFLPHRTPPPGVVARSPLMQALLRDAALVAASETRVLLTGESGVGKEVLADLIHAWSPRAAGPLVKVNCAALPEALLESELFGHEKGAFTGAVAQRLGRFEQAAGGTIFLDEIGDMSPPLQAKLLRVTQDGRFQRVGSNRDIHADARILAATNRNLEAEVRLGRFRDDLFYRLNVVEIGIPPLRERREDILPLAQRFLEELTQGRARLSPTAGEALERYPWPGNIRELRNAVERAALLSRGEIVLPEHLPGRIRSAAAPTGGGIGLRLGAAFGQTSGQHDPLLPASPPVAWSGAAGQPAPGSTPGAPLPPRSAGDATSDSSSATGPGAQTPAGHPVTGDATRLEEIERQLIVRTLHEHGFNRTETARSLGISRRALIYKLQRLRELGLPVDPPPADPR